MRLGAIGDCCSPQRDSAAQRDVAAQRDIDMLLQFHHNPL